MVAVVRWYGAVSFGFLRSIDQSRTSSVLLRVLPASA